MQPYNFGIKKAVNFLLHDIKNFRRFTSLWGEVIQFHEKLQRDNEFRK